MDDEIKKHPLMDQEEVAAFFGVTTRTIKRWRDAGGKFPKPFRNSDRSRLLYWKRSEIEDYVR